MSVALKPRELHGLTIAGKKFEAGTLKLTPEGGEEVTVICDCGRCHWLATTRETGRGVILTIVCHNCNQRIELPYVGPVP